MAIMTVQEMKDTIYLMETLTTNCAQAALNVSISSTQIHDSNGELLGEIRLDHGIGGYVFHTAPIPEEPPF